MALLLINLKTFIKSEPLPMMPDFQELDSGDLQSIVKPQSPNPKSQVLNPRIWTLVDNKITRATTHPPPTLNSIAKMFSL